MKSTSITTLALCSLLPHLTFAAEDASSPTTSLNVAQILSAYIPDQTLSIPGAESTSLASAIWSVATTWYDSPQFTSLNSAILSAAPTASAASFEASGIPYGEVYTESWYTKNVPTKLQSVLQAQFSAYDSVEAKFLGTATSASSTATSKNAAAMRTAAPVMVMGVVGMVGAMGVF